MLPEAVKKAVVVLCLQSQLHFDHKKEPSYWIISVSIHTIIYCSYNS